MIILIIFMFTTILFTLAVHEGGHILAILLTHAGKVKEIVISWKGVGVKWEPYADEPIKRSIVSLSGSAVNLILAVVFYSVGLDFFGLASLVFGLVNLLPLPGSDGLRALSSLKNAI